MNSASLSLFSTGLVR